MALAYLPIWATGMWLTLYQLTFFLSHELVQAHHPKISSAMNAACNSNSNVTYLVSCWPPWTVAEGDMARFFVKDLGLALAPKMCPDQSQASKMLIRVRRLPQEEKKKAIFSDWAACRCPKACLYEVQHKYSKNWLRRTNIKSFLTPKIKFYTFSFFSPFIIFALLFSLPPSRNSDPGSYSRPFSK